jgi:4-hydroxybenzoyl-CoA reductase subunit beta
MRLPPFELRAPSTAAEVAAILAGEGTHASVLAGGTDLLPNMKRRQQVPGVVVSLRRVAELHGIATDAATLDLGAAATLAEIVSRREVAASHPALWRAAAQVATPHLRNAASIGGNICLDTRCNYYDQNEEWRRAIGYCMKKDGDTCWVATSSPRCLAVSSTDCAPALIALGAEVSLLSREGSRRVRVEDLYENDGIHYMSQRADELLTRVHVPHVAGLRSTYWKLRRRGSIDFPVLGVAAALAIDPSGEVHDARIVLGAVSSKPQRCEEAASMLVGRPLTREGIEAAAKAAAKLAKPMDNTDFELHWRKSVVEHHVAGALRELRGDDPSLFPPLARRAAMAASAPI